MRPAANDAEWRPARDQADRVQLKRGRWTIMSRSPLRLLTSPCSGKLSGNARPGLVQHGRKRLFGRSEEHTSELQSLMRISYAVFCLKKKKTKNNSQHICHNKIITRQCDVYK